MWNGFENKRGLLEIMRRNALKIKDPDLLYTRKFFIRISLRTSLDHRVINSRVRTVRARA